MSLRTYPGRFLAGTASASALVLVLCGSVAVYLDGEQARTASVLSENIGSRMAAANAEESLNDLIALHRQGATHVEPVHDRISGHLSEINALADKEQERVLAHRAVVGFQAYQDAWATGRSPAELIRLLRDGPLAACVELRNYNAGQIEESDRDHRRAIRRTSWGLAVVGGLGSVGGLVLGYGLARGLRRTINQFLVRVQSATDLLGQELPAVEWKGGGTPGDGTDDLVGRVEQVVHKLHQREREVRRAERLAALGQLAAGVAHEVRNPLAAVLLLVEASRRDPAAGGLADDDLDLIEQELHRIERSLRGFLDYARPPRPQRSACDLGDIVRDAIALTRARADQQRVAVRLTLPTPPVPLNADPEQLRQVVLNLLLNALDAMPGGGELTVSVPQPETGCAELIVADCGPGIAADVLPRLFEPFASGKETGLGLGLVVSKRIVEDHGGLIRGSNRPGKGAQFVVRIPVAADVSLPASELLDSSDPGLREIAQCQHCSSSTTSR